jgi:GcrA cell cycle regulator
MSIETWTAERIAQLRQCIASGLTCSQAAAEIGVTRNAVIGKIHRLGLSPARPAGAPARSCPPRARHPRLPPSSRLLRLIGTPASGGVADAATAEPAPVDSAQRCSLLEIAQDKCHWPIGDPHAADFAFCGNAAVTGFSYCAGHARMAYRLPVRRRA